MKQCFKCKEMKDESEFSPDKRTKDGLFSYCKACNSVRSSTHYHKNFLEVRQKNRERDAKDRDKARSKCASWWAQKRNDDPAYCLWAGARNRASKSGVPFTILREEITIPTHCPVLGIPLKLDNTKGFRDSSPSIDQIRPGEGYTPDNIIVISWRANRIKNDSSLEELEALLTFYKNLTITNS